MKSLDKYIKDILNAESFDDALNVLDMAIKSYGFEYYCFSNMSTHSSPAIFKLNDLKTNYPSEWLQIYIEKQFVFHDPVAIHIMANKAPFYWNQMLSSCEREFCDISQNVIEHAQSFGIVDGMGFSYLHNQGNLHTLAIAKSEMIEDYDSATLSQFYLMGSALVERYEVLRHNKDKAVDLSKQEKTIVTYGAIGKTDNEIAQLMDLNVNTIRYHWKNIFEKLDSYSRVFAIIQAMNLGFIDNQIFEITTEDGSSSTYRRMIN